MVGQTQNHTDSQGDTFQFPVASQPVPSFPATWEGRHNGRTQNLLGKYSNALFPALEEPPCEEQS